MDAEFYRGLLDTVTDGVYFVTRDRHITYWNAGAVKITGYAAEEVVGHKLLGGHSASRERPRQAHCACTAAPWLA